MDKFVHRLCLELHMTKAELTARMGVIELMDWIAYFADDGSVDVEDLTPEQIAQAFGAAQ